MLFREEERFDPPEQIVPVDHADYRIPTPHDYVSHHTRAHLCRGAPPNQAQSYQIQPIEVNQQLYHQVQDLC